MCSLDGGTSFNHKLRHQVLIYAIATFLGETSKITLKVLLSYPNELSDLPTSVPQTMDKSTGMKQQLCAYVQSIEIVFKNDPQLKVVRQKFRQKVPRRCKCSDKFFKKYL